MYVARVLTNLTCNHNCAFCTARAPVDPAPLIRAEAVRARIDAALVSGAREIVITGGEPTLRRDLPAIVRYTKRAGAGTVVLETNGALIDERAAGILAQAGLDRARVHLPAWGEAADAISRDPGAFPSVLAGMRALGRAGVTLEVGTPIIAANVATVATLPAALAGAGLPVRAMVLFVPVMAPDPSALVPLERAAQAIEEVATAAREVGLEVRLDPGSLVPPCLASRPARVAHLYSLTRGGADRRGWTRPEACAPCTVRDRCPGLPDAASARGDHPAVRPILEDRTRRRLSIISSVEEQVAREMLTRERRSDIESEFDEVLVRLNYHCNQSCTFCFVSTHLPSPAADIVEKAIIEVSRAGDAVTFSGGEPTLHPRLVEYVGLARREGARRITLQTNAIRLADPALVGALAGAGLDHAFVSLHGSTAEISDCVTEAPGTFDRTVAGIDEIARAKLELRLNFVFCRRNHDDFPRYVEWVHGRWPGASINISFVAPSTDMVPRDRALIPRYSEVRPFLEAGVARAREMGVQLSGFESMCGLPLCLVPEEARRLALTGAPEIAEGKGGGEFMKTDACRACSIASRCWGIRKGYADLYGIGELSPVA